VRKIGWILVVALLLVSCLVAQSPNATINGVVLDPSGATIVGAEIVVVNDATGAQYPTKTNGEGIYAVPNLPPGSYHIQVSDLGFKTIIKPDIVLHIQDALDINFTLPIGAASEIVTVRGGASLINTENAAVSTVVDRTYVENMPLNGRSFQDLILLTPGITTNSPESASSINGYNGEFSVNGQRTESNYYTVDGVSANTGIYTGSVGPGTTGSVSAATALGTTQSLVSIDALQEFRVQSSSYSAEYGRSPGGQFSFVTRAGTNDWHGSAFDYVRNGALDANNWFNDYYGQPNPPLRQNDFGGTFGGPVSIPGLYSGKDRTFFFFSYEGLRLEEPRASTVSYVPDAVLRQNTPTPLQAVLRAFPLPNGPEVLDSSGNATGLAEFVGTWSNPSSLDAYSIRLDHAFNHGLKLFFRFSDTGSSAFVRGVGTGNPTTPSVVQSSSYAARTYTFGATKLLFNRMSNELRLNYSSNSSISQSRLDNFGGAEPVDLAALQGVRSLTNSYAVTPALSFAGHFTGLSQQSIFGMQRQWNLTDAVTLAIARHELRFGIDFRRLTPIQKLGSPLVYYFFLGQREVENNSPDLTESFNYANIYPLIRNFSAYVQDEWRIARRLNLSMGLRWEVNPATGVTKGPLPLTIAGADDLRTMTLAPPGTPSWKTSWYNFAPRLGVVYNLHDLPDFPTVLRCGGGVFFDTGQQTGASGFAGPNYQAYNLLGSIFGSPTSFPLTPAEAQPVISQNPVPPYGPIYAYPRHLQLPYSLEWNVTIEQGLGSSQALAIAYVGSHAARLIEVNQVTVSLFNPNFSDVIFYQNGSTADYDSLQLQFRRRISHGLTALAAYTWSHSIDYGSSGMSFPYFRGNSNFDVRHSFSTAVSYDLPQVTYASRFARAALHGWGVDDRVMARTAFPVSLDGSTQIDPATGQTTNAGLQLIPGQAVYLYGANCASVLQGLGSLSSGQGCPGNRAVNPSAFCDPTAGPCPGIIAPRNFVRGFGAWQMDLAIRREFPIHEDLKLQFRAEAFNVFNHPNFGVVDANFGDVSFGQSTATLNSSLGILSPLYQMGGPRSMQFALKLLF
jgi:Carboxypeptidase regulatory-like domain/TonB dependent receptor-like, beta-barrel